MVSKTVLFTTMTAREKDVDEVLRTICFVITASAVVAAALWYLKNVLVPFFLALSLKHILTPLIDAMSCAHNGCRFKLPRGVAIFLSFLVAVACLACLAAVFTYSVAAFGAHAEVYNGRIIEILDKGLALAESVQAQLGLAPSADGERSTGQELWDSSIQKVVGGINLSSAIKDLLGATGAVAEHAVYIVLFLIFMLLGDHGPSPSAKPDAGHHKVKVAANAQIKAYIKAKVVLALLVSLLHALVLWAIGLALWSVFGVLSFCLYFIPNIGLPISVCLPMPLISLDPAFGLVQNLVAFGVPMVLGFVSKDCLEPKFLGESTSIQPVAMMLAIMLWGSDCR